MRQVSLRLLMTTSALSIAAVLPLGWAAIVMWAAARPRAKVCG